MKKIILIVSLALVLSSCASVHKFLVDYANDPGNRDNADIAREAILFNDMLP